MYVWIIRSQWGVLSKLQTSDRVGIGMSRVKYLRLSGAGVSPWRDSRQLKQIEKRDVRLGFTNLAFRHLHPILYLLLIHPRRSDVR